MSHCVVDRKNIASYDVLQKAFIQSLWRICAWDGYLTSVVLARG